MSPLQKRLSGQPVRLSAPDVGALLFLAACSGLAVPLLFATRLPQTVLVGTTAAVLIVFVVRALLSRSLLPRTPIDWPNVFTLLLLPVGLWASADRTLSWPVAYKVVAGFAIFYGLAGLAHTRWLRFLPWVLLLLSAGLAAVVLVSTKWSTAKIPLIPPTVYQWLPTVRLPWRPEGIHPNLTGGAMALLLPPAVAVAAWGRGVWLRLLALLATAAVGLTLLLSQSRGAWIGAASAIFLMPTLRYRRWWLVIVGLAVAVIGGAWWLGLGRLEGLLFPAVGASETAVNTLSGRLELWSRAIYLIQDFSFTGAGLGMFEKVVLLLYPPFLIGPEGGFIHAHNVFLQTAAEFGIPGLIAHLALLLALGNGLIAAARRARNQDNQELTVLVVGLFGSLLVYIIHGQVDVPPVAPRGYALIYALFGASAALINLLNRPTGQID